MKRRAISGFPGIVIDRNSGPTLARQISEQIGRAIRTRAIGRGEPLPSSRALATSLGVSRNTVLAAYDDLAAEDLIRGHRGASMRVRGTSSSSLGRGDILRQGQFPERIALFEDCQGNSFYLNF